tara:strand:+ start:221 stop:553 length:333 start_codon:yes stop_codon:yes gene_type:complete
MQETKKQFSELEHEIIDTLIELGNKFCSESELKLRVDWHAQDGDFLTPIERFNLRIQRGEKLTPYEKQKHKKEIEQLEATRKLTKSIEKEWADQGLVWSYEKSKLIKKDN